MGVVGVPDPVRTEAVKAWVVLKPGVAGTEELATEIQRHVRERLSAHEYPRTVAFTDALPMTATARSAPRIAFARIEPDPLRLSSAEGGGGPSPHKNRFSFGLMPL